MLIVTLPARAAGDPAGYAARAATAGARALEVRGDITPRLAPFDSALPIVASPRGHDLGALLASGVAWLDQEIDEPRLAAVGARRIASWHARDRCPELEELLRHGRRARDRDGVELVKLAVHAASAHDVAILDDARRALAADGAVTVHAMGPFAALERVRSPWHNASTYAALVPEDAAAPGQLALDEHRRLQGATPPEVCGLLGGGAACARSASPDFFRALFEHHDLRSVYLALPSDDAERDLPALQRLGLRGLSVTAPHKRAAATFVRARRGELSPDAQRAAALNTIVFGERPIGHQFDTAGLCLGERDLGPRRPVAVVGSGGVVPAVLLAAQRLRWSDVTVCARDASARTALAARFGVDHAPLDALAAARPELIVWALPVDAPSIALPRATEGAVFLDLRYGPVTDVQRRARGLGFAVRDGSAMLVHQALAQFAAFTGREPAADDADRLFEILRGR